MGKYLGMILTFGMNDLLIYMQAVMSIIDRKRTRRKKKENVAFKRSVRGDTNVDYLCLCFFHGLVVTLTAILIQLLFFLLLQLNPGISERFREMIVDYFYNVQTKKKIYWLLVMT